MFKTIAQYIANFFNNIFCGSLIFLQIFHNYFSFLCSLKYLINMNALKPDKPKISGSVLVQWKMLSFCGEHMAQKNNIVSSGLSMQSIYTTFATTSLSTILFSSYLFVIHCAWVKVSDINKQTNRSIKKVTLLLVCFLVNLRKFN